jgi:hypothetical protein
MDLHILLLLTVIATIMVAVGLTGMFFSVTARLNKIEKDMRRCKSDNKTHGREIRVLKERAAQASDNIVITHRYDSSDAPRYPSKEGLI